MLTRSRIRLNRALHLFFCDGSAGRFGFLLIVLSSLLLVGLPAQATNYKFPGNLPNACSGSSGTYTCGKLTLSSSDTITIASPKPATITFTGAFTTGDGTLINASGSASDLNIVSSAVITLGANAKLIANVNGSAAINLGIGSTVGGYLSATSTTGVVTLGANSTVGSYLSTDAGAVSIGDGSTVGGAVTTSAGVVTLTKNISVGGSITTVAGGISIGDGSSTCGDVITTGAGVVVLTTNIKIGGNVSTTAGAITIGAGSTVGGNIIVSGAGVVTLTGVLVGGNISTTAGAITLTNSRVGGSVAASGAGVVTLTSSVQNDASLSLPTLCVNSIKLPTALADYRFDEATWSGVSSEVKNMVSGGVAGTSVNSSNTSTGKVCRAGVFNGSNQYLKVTNLSSLLSDTASVSFWIKTGQVGNDTMWQAPGVTGVEDSGGTNDVFWGWIDSHGRIGVMKGDTAGAQSTTSINDKSWHHIALTRNADTGMTKVYVDGSLQGQATSATGVVTTAFSSIGRIESTLGSSDAKYLNGSLDEFKVFSGVLNDSQVGVIFSNESAGKNWDGTARVCGGASVDAGAFECLETAQNNPWLSTARKPLFTKLVSTNFKLDIAALKTDGTLESNYVAAGGNSKFVKVELFDDTTSPAPTCSAYSSPVASQTVTFSSGTFSGSAGRTLTDNFFNIAGVYTKLRCRVKECTDSTCGSFSSVAPACSSDQFSVRPAAFLVSQASTAATAGSTFALQAVAVKSDLKTITTNYTATPTLNLGQITGTPGFTGAALMPQALPAATAGVSSATFTYDDVGSFTLPAGTPSGSYGISDSTFTSVDSSSGDCVVDSASYSPDGSGKIGCLIGQTASLTVGPFVPDHFEISAISFAPGCASGGFTYMGQAFTLGYTLTAKSMSRSSPNPNPPGNVPLLLYTGGQVNLIALNSSTDWITRLSPTVNNPLSPTWTNGSYTPSTTSYLFTRPSTTVADATWGPFDALNIGVAIDDASGVGYSSGTSTFTASTPTTCQKTGATQCRNYASLTGGATAKIRFGRLHMLNAYGSELLPLRVPVRAEYYLGSNAWAVNTSDTCTVIAANSLQLGSVIKPTATVPSNLAFSAPAAGVTVTPLKGGIGYLTLTPSVRGAGSADLVLNLGGGVGTSSCATLITPVGGSAPPAAINYLAGNWCGGSYNKAPIARIKFGSPKAPYIYLRERY